MTASKFNTLQKINLKGMSGMHRDHLLILVASFPIIEQLNLRGCYKLSLISIAWLLDGLSQLRNLDLTDCDELLNEIEFVRLSKPVSPPASD